MINDQEKRTKGGMKKVTVRMWRSDWEWLREHHPANLNDLVRRIIGAWILERRAEDAEKES